MVEARATWVDEERFLGQASSGHGIVLDGAQVKSGNSPMELVLVGLCGCTAIDVVSILRKLIYRVGGKVSHKAVEDAVRLSEEKYCSVAAMLNKTAKISYEIEYAD